MKDKTSKITLNQETLVLTQNEKCEYTELQTFIFAKKEKMIANCEKKKKN